MKEIFMGNLKSAMAVAASTGLSQILDLVPDPVLKAQLKALSFAVLIPYAFLKELLPTEADEFIRQVYQSGQITQEVINSPEFSQAVGSTMQNMAYAKDRERRDIIKNAFLSAYVSEDQYARSNLERIQDVASRISIDALRHLGLVKRDILPKLELGVRSKMGHGTLPVGYTTEEHFLFLRYTTPISNFYDQWYRNQDGEARRTFEEHPSDDNRRIFDLRGAVEQKQRRKFSEYWSEFDGLGIFRQGNDPAIGTMGGAGGTVQYHNEFGDRFISYVNAIGHDVVEDGSIENP